MFLALKDEAEEPCTVPYSNTSSIAYSVPPSAKTMLGLAEASPLGLRSHPIKRSFGTVRSGEIPFAESSCCAQLSRCFLRCDVLSKRPRHFIRSTVESSTNHFPLEHESSDFRLCGYSDSSPQAEPPLPSQPRLEERADPRRLPVIDAGERRVTRSCFCSAFCLRIRSYLFNTYELAVLSKSECKSSKDLRVSAIQKLHFAHSATGATSGMSVIFRLPSLRPLWLRLIEERRLLRINDMVGVGLCPVMVFVFYSLFVSMRQYLYRLKMVNDVTIYHCTRYVYINVAKNLNLFES